MHETFIIFTLENWLISVVVSPYKVIYGFLLYSCQNKHLLKLLWTSPGVILILGSTKKFGPNWLCRFYNFLDTNILTPRHASLYVYKDVLKLKYLKKIKKIMIEINYNDKNVTISRSAQKFKECCVLFNFIQLIDKLGEILYLWCKARVLQKQKQLIKHVLFSLKWRRGQT